MVTKTKTPSKATAKAHTPKEKAPLQPVRPAATKLDKAVSDQMAKAIKLVESEKYAEAIKLLESLLHQAETAQLWSLKRVAQTYLNIAHHKSRPRKSIHGNDLFTIQYLLNQRDAKGALSAIDKALKADPKQACLHYMKSIALAQQKDEAACAESFKKALGLDPDLVHLWRLEPDFEDVRKSSLFAFTED